MRWKLKRRIGGDYLKRIRIKKAGVKRSSDQSGVHTGGSEEDTSQASPVFTGKKSSPFTERERTSTPLHHTDTPAATWQLHTRRRESRVVRSCISVGCNEVACKMCILSHTREKETTSAATPESTDKVEEAYDGWQSWA